MRNRALALGLLATLGVAACSGGTECGPGTQPVEGACVPLCGDGTEQDPVSGACVPVCAEGTRRDSATGACLPAYARCATGQVWDGAHCIAVDVLCGEGTTWVTGEQRCVPDDQLRVPDQVEVVELNDISYYPRSCEQMALPAEGERWSIGGRIEPALDVGTGLVPADDCWAFETSGPTLLRIRADGLGGASPAFKVLRLDDAIYVERIGVGTTSDSVVRDVFLPFTGTYALVATDAMNLLGGAWRGGGELGYFIEFTRLPMPEPTALTQAQVQASVRGRWPLTPPEEGSQLAFFTMPVEAATLWFMDLERNDQTVSPIIAGVTPEGRAFEADARHVPMPSAFSQDGELLIALDFETWYANRDVNFEFSGWRVPMALIDTELPATQVQVPAWSYGHTMPEYYWAFRANAGDIVTLHAQSSTGFTCVVIWNDRFDTLGTDRQCFITPDPMFTAELRIEAWYTGAYVVQVIDWGEANIVNDQFVSIPAHELTFAFDLHRQTPVALGDLDAPWSSTERVDAEERERFFRLSPNVGDAYWFDVAPEGLLAPALTVYQSGWTMGLNWEWIYWEPGFAYRSPNGEPVLFGVGDFESGEGALNLGIRRLSIASVGPLAGASPTEAAIDLARGDTRAFVSVDAAVPGLLTVEVQAAGVDLALVPRRGDLFEVPGWQVDQAGAGAAERFVRPWRQGTAFLEVVTADGLPLPAAARVSIQASVSPYTLEVEDNDDHYGAQPLTLPCTLAGEAKSNYDPDWYTFELTEHAALTLGTGQLGEDLYNSSSLRLYDATGGLLLEAPEASHGTRIDRIELPAGRYYLLVRADSGAGDAYYLEVTHAAP